jgi:acetolactate synthase-1/3 small subunit
LIEVLKIVERDSAVRRELVLVKVASGRLAASSSRSSALRRKAVDLTRRSSLSSDRSPAKLAALLDLLEPYGIRELVQSGLVALGRGNRSLTDRNQRNERLRAVRAG